MYNLKLLVSKEFPVKYSDEFYRKIYTEYKDFVRFGYFKDNIVGAIAARIE